MMLLTVKEVSKILKCNVNYVHELRKSGLLEFIKLGCYKIQEEKLNDFLEKYSGYDLTNPNKIKKL